MPTQLQFRRGTTAQNNSFTGVVGELSIDTDTDKNCYYEQTNDNSFDFVFKDTLIIDKQVVLKNVHFEHSLDDSGFALHHMVFKKSIAVENPASLVFVNCIFELKISFELRTINGTLGFNIQFNIAIKSGWLRL